MGQTNVNILTTLGMLSFHRTATKTYHAVIMLKSEMIAFNGDGSVRNFLMQFDQSTLGELVQLLSCIIGRYLLYLIIQLPQLYC